MHRFNYDTNEWTTTNVCSAAGIYGHDGTLWASSPAGSDLISSYPHEIEQEDGTVQTVQLNEAVCALGASNNNRNPTPAGIRLNRLKHMIKFYDAETKCVMLGSSTGGACVGQALTCFVVGFFNKEQKDSNGKTQN